MKTLRTPDERFRDLPDFSFEPVYTEVPDGEGGTLRIHHIDEGPRGGELVLCMHGQPTWSYLYRHMIPLLVARGLRVVAPDLVGYGRSDKPAALEDYSYESQVAWLEAWLLANDLRGATFVGQDWGGLIGLRLVTAQSDRFARVCIANTAMPTPDPVGPERVEAVQRFRREAPTPSLPEVFGALSTPSETPERQFAYWQKWCWETEDLPVGLSIAGILDGRTLGPAETAAYDAPFPEPRFKMGPRAMPSQVPTLGHEPSVAANRRAWQVLEKWQKPFLCCFTDNDPVTAGRQREFLQRVPTARERPISGGGHFLQEGRGREFAELIADEIAATSA